MKSFASYKTDTKPALLIVGPPGTGKTTIACTAFPNPYVIEIDNNIDGTFRFMEREKIQRDVRFDVPHMDDKGQIVPRLNRWKTMTDNINKARQEWPEMRTIVIDSLTGLTDYAIDEVRRQQSRVVDDPQKGDAEIRIQDWGAFAALLRKFFITLRASNLIVVVIAHVMHDKDELAGYTKEFIKCPTSFKDEIAGLFTECWRTSIEERVVSGSKQYVRVIQTVPGPRQDALGLKTSLSVGNKFDFNPQQILLP